MKNKNILNISENNNIVDNIVDYNNNNNNGIQRYNQIYLYPQNNLIQLEINKTVNLIILLSFLSFYLIFFSIYLFRLKNLKDLLVVLIFLHNVYV